MHSIRSTKNKAVVAYVPALHTGYVKFFQKYRGADIYVLGGSFLKNYPRLDRDLRALKPEQAAAGLRILKIGKRVLVLKDQYTKKLAPYKKIILPDEDVSRDFAEKYIPRQKVVLQNVFLRWDKLITALEKEPPPDRIVSKDAFDREMISRAIAEGGKSADWWRQIGAVLVLDEKIALAAHTRYFPSDLALDIFGTPRSNFDAGERPDVYISMHSEADIVAQAAEKGVSLKGASLYASTFPCINCAFLIARSGIKKLYYKQGYASLQGDEVLKHAGVEIIQVKF